MSPTRQQAFRRAIRVTLGSCAAFFIGLYAVGDTQFAVMATFTVIALGGIADFSGSAWARSWANLVSVVTGLALVAVGTWVSQSLWGATIAMFLIVFIVAFSAVYSGYFATGTTAVILFYVVASGIPTSVHSIEPRLEGVLFGGGLVMSASLLVLPSRDGEDFRQLLASLLDTLRALLSSTPGQGTPREDALRASKEWFSEALSSAQSFLANSPNRPSGPTRPHIAQMYLMQASERLESIIGQLARAGLDRSEDPLGPHELALLDRLGAVLEECAGCLRGEAAPPEAHELHEALSAFRARADDELTTELALTGSDVVGFAERLERAFLVRELGKGVLLCLIHTRLAVRAKAGELGEFVGPAVVASPRGRQVSALGKWWRRARSNLRPNSVHFRNSLRLALGLAVARLIVGGLNLQHGFWVVFATLTVLRTTATVTEATSIQALVGTGFGFAASAALIVTVGTNSVVYPVLLPFLIMGAIFLAAVNFVTAQALFTLVVVVLFNLIKPAGWSVGLVRVEDVAVGAVTGLVIGAVIWPRGAGGQLRKALADLIEASSSYAARTAERLLPRQDVADPADTSRGDDGRSQAFELGVHAEDVFAQFLSEARRTDGSPADWSDLLVGGHRLWYGADIARRFPPVGESSRTLCPAFVKAMDSLIHDAATGYEDLATSLRLRRLRHPQTDRGASAGELHRAAADCRDALRHTKEPDSADTGPPPLRALRLAGTALNRANPPGATGPRAERAHWQCQRLRR